MFFKKEMLRIEARKNENNWTLKVALRPSGVSLALDFGQMLLFFFFREMCGRVGNDMPSKGQLLVTKRWVPLDKKRWRRTSTCDMCLGGEK